MEKNPNMAPEKSETLKLCGDWVGLTEKNKSKIQNLKKIYKYFLEEEEKKRQRAEVDRVKRMGGGF